MSDQLIGRPIEILLVEDNPGDARLTQEAFREASVPNRLHLVGDGDEAMEFLHRQGHYTDAPRPDIVLLDLNLPGRGGREVLAAIKDDADLKRIPVIVLTTSTADGDIADTYDHYANCFITKPVELEEFLSVVKAIETFWLTIVVLPPE
jgi:CheY-like chemotaxis protein